ncbi:MAG: putative DNA-binding domain-containing protein [Pseudomonadota bacterium]
MDDAHIRWQRAFAAHLRDPVHHPPPPGLDPRGVATYRRLLLGNTDRILRGIFPRARRLLGSSTWDGLVARFLAEAECPSPFYREVPGAFLDWLRGQTVDLPAWLIPLLDLSWTRFRLDLAEDAEWMHPAPGRVSFNPVSCLRSYSHAVHRLTDPPEERPSDLLLFRQPDSGVRMIELRPSSLRLMQGLRDGRGLRSACEDLAGELHLPAASLVDHARRLLRDLRGAGAVRFGDTPEGW